MKQHDVIVVGGGPAGTAAAHTLAEGGADVLLLERARYPRSKVCGGALSARITSLVGDGYRPLVKSTVIGADLCLGSLEPVKVRSERPVAHLVLRTEFDSWMARRAASAGAVIRDGVVVRGAGVGEEGVWARTDTGLEGARFLIAADGSPSRIGRLFGLGPAVPRGVAIEGEAPRTALQPAGDDTLLIDLSAIAGGYGWVFPKADRISYGVAGDRSRVEDLHWALRTFRSRMPTISVLDEVDEQGHLIPGFEDPTPPIAEGRVLCVGDAAGLVDPFLGEGIYYAIYSGIEAGKAVLDGTAPPASSYSERIDRTLHPEFRAAERFARVVYRYPHIAYEIFRDHPDLGLEYLHVLAGSTSYVDFWRKVRWSAAPDFLRRRFLEHVAW